MLITQMLVSSSKYSRKCPYAMTPEGITIHNTANDASAKNEISYMIGNNNQTSFHYAVDDYQAVQGIPENRNSWNAGDGRGFGNMKTISIEICYSKSGGDRFHKAEENAAELVAILMKKYGWGTDKIGTKTINTHQYRSGKYCPHRTLDEGIDRFWNMVREKYATITGTDYNPQPETPSTSGGRKVGDVVTINGIYTSSTSTKKLNPARTSGTITKIVSARNPYLLDYGNLGWTNDSCITGSTGGSSSSSNSGKSIDEVAQEVINGKWGNGTDRKSRLQAAGYNYSEVQAKVNEILTGKSSSSSSSSSKSIDTLADEVIAGKWGKGADRKNRLKAAGYNYDAVQAKVNEKLGVKSGNSSSSSSSSSIKVGDKVKVKSGAKDYNGTRLANSVYSNTYNVIEVSGNRVVIGKGSAVTAAVNKSNLYKV